MKSCFAADQEAEERCGEHESQDAATGGGSKGELTTP